MSNYNFFCPTRVLFGQGSLNEFHKQPMPGKKALLVISNGQSMIKNGSLERVKKRNLLLQIVNMFFSMK